MGVEHRVVLGAHRVGVGLVIDRVQQRFDAGPRCFRARSSGWQRSGCDTAATSPRPASLVWPPQGRAWASEVTNLTPLSPRAHRSRKNASQPAWVLLVAICTPITSRCPWALTPVATITEASMTRPPSCTFIVNASAASNVYGPESKG